MSQGLAFTQLNIHQVERVEVARREAEGAEWLEVRFLAEDGSDLTVIAFANVGSPTVLDLRKRQDAEAEAA